MGGIDSVESGADIVNRTRIYSGCPGSHRGISKIYIIHAHPVIKTRPVGYGLSLLFLFSCTPIWDDGKQYRGTAQSASFMLSSFTLSS